MRSRLIARVVTGIYDDALRPLAIGSAQFVLLVVIGQLQPANRAEIGRFHRQDPSTLTRNLKIILSAGWAEELEADAKGRSRPMALTKAGEDLIARGAPYWRTAQEKTKALLGQAGIDAVTSVADGILRAP